MRKIEYKTINIYGIPGYCLTPCPLSTDGESMCGSGFCIDYCNYNGAPGDWESNVICCNAPLRADELHKGPIVGEYK